MAGTLHWKQKLADTLATEDGWYTGNRGWLVHWTQRMAGTMETDGAGTLKLLTEERAGTYADCCGRRIHNHS